jgi:hypothetical protein
MGVSPILLLNRTGAEQTARDAQRRAREAIVVVH